MLQYNKNYTTLVFNYILKNSKVIISASEINGRYKNNNIEKKSEHIKLLKELL